MQACWSLALPRGIQTDGLGDQASAALNTLPPACDSTERPRARTRECSRAGITFPSAQARLVASSPGVFTPPREFHSTANSDQLHACPCLLLPPHNRRTTSITLTDTATGQVATKLCPGASYLTTVRGGRTVGRTYLRSDSLHPYGSGVIIPTGRWTDLPAPFHSLLHVALLQMHNRHSRQLQST